MARRWLLMAVLVAVVVLVLLYTDGDYAHAARHFLSNLLRRMF